VLLTRSPLVYPRKGLTARLACVKHAASVRPEPGSNSPTKSGSSKPRRGLGYKQTGIKPIHDKARHTVEFSKDTRTPSTTAKWHPGHVFPPYTSWTLADPGAPVGRSAGPADRAPEGLRSVRRPADKEKVTRGLDSASNRPPQDALTCGNSLFDVTGRGRRGCRTRRTVGPRRRGRRHSRRRPMASELRKQVHRRLRRPPRRSAPCHRRPDQCDLGNN
jgi:hypothetical protein